MKVVCITVGKKHDVDLANIIADYEKRLHGHCDFSWQYIPSSDTEKESAAILGAIKDEDSVVLLDERGKLFNNAQMSQYIEKTQNQSTKRVLLIIGGAYGVNNDVARRANVILALSPLVFPHQIVRLLVVEQLYRSYSILAGSGYHHS